MNKRRREEALIRGCSSAGRASDLHSEGSGFESCHLHHIDYDIIACQSCPSVCPRHTIGIYEKDTTEVRNRQLFWSQSVHGRTRHCHCRRRGSLPLETAMRWWWNGRHAGLRSQCLERESSSLSRRTIYKMYSSIAQSVEQRTVNPWVSGSSPLRGAKFSVYSAVW